MQSLLHNPGYALRQSSELYAAATLAQSAEYRRPGISATINSQSAGELTNQSRM
jgi:hypothetical protein